MDEGIGHPAEASAAATPAPVEPAAVQIWLEAALEALGEERGAIDALNVFPVPDGDTGTNMFLTLESACGAVQGACDEAQDAGRRASLPEVTAALSRGAMLGARGNSGVILAQILRAVAAELVEGSVFDAALLRRVLRRACDEAYAAVGEPVEGTILTVARAAAEGAEAYPGDDVTGLMRASASRAQRALDETPQMLPVLRDAGVVDAGGQGLVVVYDALLDVVSGVRRRRPGQRGITARGPARPLTRTPGQAAERAETGTAGPAYEVMYLVETDDAGLAQLRGRLSPLGDSLVVTGSAPQWSVHVHVDDVGAAIESALDIGRPSRIRVTYLAAPGPASTRRDTDAAVRAGGRAVVAVSHGPGVAAILQEQGVVTIGARPRRRPSTGEILDGIGRAGTSEVIVLPSDSDTCAVAEAAAEEARRAGTRVSVIPTRSIVQTLAAVAVHDSDARFDDDVVAMSRAAGATHYGAVTVASREALTSAGPCAPGDILGLADGDIVEVGPDALDVALDVLSRLMSTGGELVTVVTGLEADPLLPARIENWVAERHPGTDVVVIDGGQPLWPVILGVE